MRVGEKRKINRSTGGDKKKEGKRMELQKRSGNGNEK